MITLFTMEVRCERDVVSTRQRARQIAGLLGFETQDQTRIATTVSEIARNAFRYAGGGKTEFRVDTGTPPALHIHIRDQGPGIVDLPSILEGRYTSETGMGLGLVGARRLMDQFQIESSPGAGTTVLVGKNLPRRKSADQAQELPRILKELARHAPDNPFEEIQLQNQELLRALGEVQARQAELAQLNHELNDTNRGVLALYAELDEKAAFSERASELKSRFLWNMTHEFRTPLSSILSLARLLLEHADGKLL